MKRGFTLVELSIVLVIIGLLIGGILIARSMIGTTKIQAQIRQIQQLDAAITNFQTKYNQLPGDSVLFGSQLQSSPTVGNNNGNIEGISLNIDESMVPVQDPNYPQFSGESAEVWFHLQLGVGLYPKLSFTDDQACNNQACIFSGPLIHMPPAAINNKTGILVGYDDSFLGTDFNAYVIAAFDVDANLEESSTIISCVDTAAIDTKMDDGSPGLGNIRTPNCDNGSNGYLTDPSALALGMEIKILSQTGQN